WTACERYLRGIDLFNRGYYWESHEAWEGLWHAAGREGTVGLFLKGLIKLSAAGVKVRQQRLRGVAIHAGRSVEHLSGVRSQAAADVYCGIDLPTLIGHAESTRDGAEGYTGFQGSSPVEVVFPWRIQVCEAPIALETQSEDPTT
ncbi:MAG: DUF309 domain-containing protein, partial [Planctomycetota bacterium]